MKKIVGVLLAFAMIISMAIPAMAAGEDTSGDYELSYEDAQWDKGYDDGYSLGYAEAAAGHERVALNKNSAYEEGKSSGYDAGYDDFLYDQEIQEGVNQEIRDAGGVPGRINVKLNDKCIAFPDAVPELQNGSTMVPVRALMEALGAKVTMDQNIVTMVLGSTSIQMAVGDAVATVDKNGSKEQVKLGAASYLKSGRVYIPLRFVSEVLGFQVKWDQDYQCVVVLDRASIVKKLNERFGTANIFMQSQAKLLSGNWLTEGSFNMNVEVIDSINGNKTYATTGTLKSHSGNGAMDIEATLDLSKFAGMLESFKALSDADTASPLKMLKCYLKMNHFSMKVTPKGDYYVRSELYDFMATNLLGATLDQNKETWYRMGYMDPSLFKAEGYNVGNYLYSMMMDEESPVDTPFTSYDSLMEMAASMERFMGDSRFKKQGESYVLSMSKEQVLSFAGEDQELKEALNSAFQELNLTLSFTKDGTYSIGGSVKLQMEGLGALMNVKLDQNGTAEASNGNMQLQVRNLFNLTMKAKSTASKTQSAPDTSIPKDAQIIDFMNLANGIQ